jgi:hypothetical protein
MKTISTNVFKEAEQQAYHAFLEWPLWLVLRDKELTAAIQAASQESVKPNGKRQKSQEK